MWLFVLCSEKLYKYANVRMMVNPGHTGHRQKALVIARMTKGLYWVVNVGIKEKRRNGLPHCT